MTTVKIICIVVGIFAILVTFMGGLVSANSTKPLGKVAKFYRWCFYVGVFALVVAAIIHFVF